MVQSTLDTIAKQIQRLDSVRTLKTGKLNIAELQADCTNKLQMLSSEQFTRILHAETKSTLATETRV